MKAQQGPDGAGQVLETAVSLPHVFNPSPADGACQAWALRRAPQEGGPATAPCGLYAEQHSRPSPQPCTCPISCGYSCKGECGCTDCARWHAEHVASHTAPVRLAEHCGLCAKDTTHSVLESSGGVPTTLRCTVCYTRRPLSEIGRLVFLNPRCPSCNAIMAEGVSVCPGCLREAGDPRS